MEDPILQFTVLVGAALLAQLTVERARLPGLLGLVVLGMVMGPGGLEVLPREPVVEFLGHIGLVYVIFLAGLEIDLDVARDHAAESVGFGGLGFTFSALPALALGLLVLGLDPAGAVLLAALLSSHTLLAYPVIERLGLLRHVPVVTAIGGTILTDTAALLTLAIVLSVAGGEALGWLVPLGLLAALTFVSLVGVPRLSRAFFQWDGASRAEKALFALVILLVLSSTAELIGTDEVLGAFLAGLALNRSLASREELREHIEFVGRMLFLPFFFIYTGMLLDMERLLDPGLYLMAGALTACVVGGKGLAAWVMGARHGYPLRDRVLMVGLTIPQAAATLAIAITAHEAGLLDQVVVDAAVLLIFFTCLAGPIIVARAGERVRAAGDRAAGAADEAVRREV
jgi:Kef-type K+ transport system membrane component KefB